jgi:tight adherence protein B
MFSVLLLAFGAILSIGMIAFALAGPSGNRSQNRRLAAVRERHGDAAVVTEARMRRISNARVATKMDLFGRILPNREQLAKRLAMTGKTWSVGGYGGASVGIAAVLFVLMALKGLPLFLALFAGLAAGAGLPHWYVGRLIRKRVTKFTTKFPDAIELLVRGLRSGLPISETMGVVGSEVDGPVGEEFRSVSDKMKIGRTMDVALQETADRLGTPEFQFFVITIAIQRETGGNLAETLANLAEVLRKRSQMKLKIRAMSSESKASAYIIGSLPFIVFIMIWFLNNAYMATFFTDQRLMMVGMGGMVWMGMGAFTMSKMINFEI